MTLQRYRKHLWLLLLFVVGSSAPTSEAAYECSSLFLRTDMEPLGNTTYTLAPLQIMTRRFRGGLKGITQQLSAIRRNSDVLLLTGLNPQTVESMPDGKGGTTDNYTGYWPSNHNAIYPEIGSFADLRSLCDKANAQGIRVMVDAVPAHFGYEGANSEFYFNGTPYRRLSEIPDGVLRPKDEIQRQDWDNLEKAADPTEVFRLWDEVFARKRLYGLPGFNHSNPAVKEHLIASYKGYIDAGVRGFRIDATLYLERHFVSDFINTLSAHARSKGRDLAFHLELLVQNDFTLKVMAEDILSRVQNKSEVFFLDFPLMSELRRGVDIGTYKLNWLKGFFENRTRLNVDQLQLVPTLVNHDFGYPINAPEREALLYALYGFLNARGALILAGTENTSAQKRLDSNLSFVDSTGKIAILNSSLGQILKDYRDSSVSVEEINDKTIRLVRKNGAKSLVLFANLDSPQSVTCSTDLGSHYRMLLKSDGAQWRLNENQLTFPIGKPNFIHFEVSHE